jgi:hypothetical protein
LLEFDLRVRLLQRKTATLLGGVLRAAHQVQLLSRVPVNTVFADPEPGFSACAAALAEKGIRLVLVAPERHVRVAERAIQEIKDLMRCTLSLLPFKLPGSLMPFLAQDVIVARNSTSHKRRDQSPRELLGGSRADLGRDFKYAFGDIGHTRRTAIAQRDDLDPRTELSVVVGRSINEAGAVTVWLPRSHRIVHRSSFIPIQASDADLRAIVEAGGADTDHSHFLDPLPGTSHDATGHIQHIIDPFELSRTSLSFPAAGPPPVAPSGDKPRDGPIASPKASTLTPALALPPLTLASAPVTFDTSPAPSAEATPSAASPADPAAPATSPSVTSPSTVSGAAALPATAGQREPPQRQSSRTRTAPRRATEEGYLAQSHSSNAPGPGVELPPGNLTVRQALALNEPLTRQAVRAELQQMLSLGVFERSDHVPGTNVLPSKMFLKWKISSDATKLKARLVIGGHLQERDTIGETYSPTVCAESVNVALCVAAHYGILPYTVDVSGAFLHVPLGGAALYMRLPRSVVPHLLALAPEYSPCVAEDGSVVVRIRKAIYGLSESSLQWHEHLTATLRSLGYTTLSYDSVFILRDRAGRTRSLLCVHVDDLLVVAFQNTCRDRLLATLTAAYCKVSASRDAPFTYLGVHIVSRGPQICLNQRLLIDAIDYASPSRASPLPADRGILDTSPCHRSSTLPTVIHQDNVSTMIMMNKGELGTKRTKHFTVFAKRDRLRPHYPHYPPVRAGRPHPRRRGRSRAARGPAGQGLCSDCKPRRPLLPTAWLEGGCQTLIPLPDMVHCNRERTRPGAKPVRTRPTQRVDLATTQNCVTGTS